MIVSVIYSNNVNKATDEVRFSLVNKYGLSFVQILNPENNISNDDIDREFIIIQVPEGANNINYVNLISRAGLDVKELIFIIYRPIHVLKDYTKENDFTIISNHSEGIKIPRSNWNVMILPEEQEVSLDMDTVDTNWPGQTQTFLGEEVPEWITDEQIDTLDNLHWVITEALDNRQFPARDMEFKFVKSNYIAMFLIEKDFVIKVRPDMSLVYAYRIGRESNIITGLTISQLEKIMV